MAELEAAPCESTTTSFSHPSRETMTLPHRRAAPEPPDVAAVNAHPASAPTRTHLSGRAQSSPLARACLTVEPNLTSVVHPIGTHPQPRGEASNASYDEDRAFALRDEDDDEDHEEEEKEQKRTRDEVDEDRALALRDEDDDDEEEGEKKEKEASGDANEDAVADDYRDEDEDEDEDEDDASASIRIERSGGYRPSSRGWCWSEQRGPVAPQVGRGREA